MSVVENIPLEPRAKRQSIEPNDPLSYSNKRCGHWFVHHGVCTACDSSVDESQGQAFDYLLYGLQLSHEAVAVTKHLTTLVSCSNKKKLHLVLDLDHTLLHTTHLLRLTEAEKYLIEEAGSNTRDDLYKWQAQEFFTKLRPFVREFLEEANKLFTMSRKSTHAKPYSEEKTDESENDGGLAIVLKIFKEVHCGFFNVVEEKELEFKDVRLLLQEIEFNHADKESFNSVETL
ncbi:unnamed protein product [Eruca vesicaria subsp. sativa]|uniref:protein-serine/threonine phosphatase n=1 Tax=Eruca vesicaria subsp. sativa TaxID=29727 RepID=A0ABC8LP88_ERUVS|nr:unnamed protein product [Eruca vesicaria subsp. sativa]